MGSESDDTGLSSDELSTGDRTRILLEERYRHEVVQQLDAEKKDNGRKRFVQFLNSAFGLWLLSVVLVTGLGSAYTTWKDYREQNRLRTAKVEQLDLEIAYRISRVL